jgi:hypothetical protein
MIGLLLALYPTAWRRRYGEEFTVVLESRPLGPFDVADVLLGALDARSRALRGAGSPETSGGRHTMLRLGGFGAIAGGLLWIVGLGGGSAANDGNPVWAFLMGAGSLALLVAFAGLSAFQAHRDLRLAWAAFLIPSLGSLVTIAGLYGTATVGSDNPMVFGWEPWGVLIAGLLLMLVGSILFGIATVRAEVLSPRAAQALVVSSAAFLFVGVLGLSGDGTSGGGTSGALATATVLTAFGGSWAWLGLSALRRGPIRAVAPA